MTYTLNRMTSSLSQQQPCQQQQPQQQQPTVKQRVFSGTVTKLHENFGFIDDDVIFQASAVKGTCPQVGDRVLVEASYNGAMPFKWNAQRVQVIAPSQQSTQKLSASFNSSGNYRSFLMGFKLDFFQCSLIFIRYRKAAIQS